MARGERVNEKIKKGGGKMRRAIPILAMMVVALAVIGIVAAAGSSVTPITTATAQGATTNTENNQQLCPKWHWGKMRGPFGRGFGSAVSVSEEFQQNVINIANTDPDVQNLLSAGYENIRVIPMIKAVVQGNGDVAFKATSAVLTLVKNGSHAFVYVDLEAGKVTKIVKVERTVIEKT